jgi:hypothetical protein
MSIDGQGRSDGGSPGLLRALSLVAVVAGAAGSVVFMLRAGQRTPRLLLVLFTVYSLRSRPFYGPTSFRSVGRP